MTVPKSCVTKEEIINYKNESRKRNYASTRKPSNRRKFTAEEDSLIISHNMTDRELSDLIMRSCQSIQMRRQRLKSGQAKSNYKLYM